MNKKKESLFWENFYSQKIRFANRSGSYKNHFRYFPNNSDEHEDTKYIIFKKLRKLGYSVWTEGILTTGQRFDIMACKENKAWIIEIETDKPSAELQEKINQKRTYPVDFELVIVNTKDFKIEDFSL